MDRRAVGVGVLAVVAVAFAAGAVSPSTAPASGGGVAFGAGGEESGVGAALGGVLWLVVLSALVAGGAWVFVERVRSGGGGERLRRRFVALTLAVAATIAGVLLVAVRVFEDGDGPGGPDGVGGPLVQGSPERTMATGAPGAGVVLAVLVALAVLVGGVLAVRRLRRSSSSDTPATADEDGEGDDGDGDADAASSVDEAALGAAAGRAATHLEGVGSAADNDVVRAWRELADVLELSRPASSTPREFAAAATAAGVDRAAVAELTKLFEAVRYGDRDPTGDRAERAIAALERIEATDDTGAPVDDATDRDGTRSSDVGDHAGTRSSDVGDHAGTRSSDADDSGGGRR
jgi:hypothetical protein